MQPVTRGRPGKVDYLERISRAVTVLAFVAAALACLAAPLSAIAFSNRPFPGFLVEQTLVVASTSGPGWTGSEAGIRYPQRVMRIGGRAVTTGAQFDAVLAERAIGDHVAVLTKLPDGTVRVFPSVTLVQFPPRDMLRLFMLPYLVGLAYLAMGVWMYRARGLTRPGRALAFFCVSAAMSCTLLFDLDTTHVGTMIWTVAIAQLGGALVSLAMRFPDEWHFATRWPWLLALPYSVSVLLALQGLSVVNDTTQPWAYIGAWAASYRYIGVGMLVFLGTVAYRAGTGRSLLIRRQARIVLLGSFLAFLPLTIWAIAPVFGVAIPFNGILFLPGLVIFPLSVGMAILRYRLLEVDVIVNRTIVWGTLTAILAGVFTAAMTVMQKLFVAVTGEKSDAALVLTTLIVAAAFAPLKARLQVFVDRRFKQAPDQISDLRGFGDQVRAFVQMSDTERITGRLLDEAARGLQAESGALSLFDGGRLRTVHTYGYWRGEAWVSIPLESDGELLGLLTLGPRANQEQYTRQECEALQQVAAQVAHAVRLARMTHQLSSFSVFENARPVPVQNAEQ
jgi:hypothetical protein